MRVHSLQHVWFEDLTNIEPWLRKNGHSVTKTFLWNYESLPAIEELDWLIIMGGPMNIYEEREYPWLRQEKEFIRSVIDSGKRVLGICLGAQLIAAVLGGKVRKNIYREIGWHRVKLSELAKTSKVFNALASEFTAFHWHGDTFDLPSACTRTAASEGCPNQAFEYDHGRVVGLQFHLESSLESVRALIQNCKEDLEGGPYVQTADEILSCPENFRMIEKNMESLLKQMMTALCCGSVVSDGPKKEKANRG